MPKQREISPSLREQAIGLYKGGSGISFISRILSNNCSSLHYLIRKWKSTGSTKNLPRAGRPPLVTQRGKRQLKSIVKSNRTSSLRNLTGDLIIGNKLSFLMSRNSIYLALMVGN